MWPTIDLGIVQIPTFYLVLSLASTISLIYTSKRLPYFKKIDSSVAINLLMIILISGFIGGRLLHIIYEEPQYYLGHPLQIIKFWNGGFVYYGGLIAALISSLIYLKKQKKDFFLYADFLTPSFSLAYGLGRIACFFEGCCYGSYCSFPWAIQQKHPTQLYMSAAELILFIFIQKIKIAPPYGKIFSIWLVFHTMTRFFIEYFRGDDRGRMILDLFSLSQVISLILFFLSLLFFYLIKKKYFEKNTN